MKNDTKENFEYKPSANRWYWPVVVDGTPLDEKGISELLLSQKQELPFLMSGILERTCNLQCKHCLYGREMSSKLLSESSNLQGTIVHMAGQLPKKTKDYNPAFMSCGRILRPWHLPIFETIRKNRPDIALGTIDNGTFTNLLSVWPQGFKFDWVDISIDGIEEHHDEQRMVMAYEQAMKGLRHVREVVKTPENGGKVSSLLTLTTINAGDIEAVADLLLSKNSEGRTFVDELDVTTISPTNETNAPLETDVETFKIAWEGLKAASKKYPPRINHQGRKVEQVIFKVYRVEDMEKLAGAIGERKFMEAFYPNEEHPENNPKVERNNIEVTIDGVVVNYMPLSIWTPEEFLIDADAVYRTAYEGMFTLAELRAGTSLDGRDTTPYTITPLDIKTDLRGAYEKGVDHWWHHFGAKKFDEEMEAFARIRNKWHTQGSQS